VFLASGIRKQLGLQLALIAVASIVFFMLYGIRQAGSAWFGGGIAMANLLLLDWRRRVADTGPALSAAANIRLLYRSALERFVAVIALFTLGMGGWHLDPLALMAGFVAGQTALFYIGNERKSGHHGV